MRCKLCGIIHICGDNKMAYDEDTKRRCISLRRAFNKVDTKDNFIDRRKDWVEFVKNSKLSESDKVICIKEFLSFRDLARYRKRLMK